MFTRDGIRELHGWTHESLDILLRHIASVPGERLREVVAGFGIATVWKQLVHIDGFAERKRLKKIARAKWKADARGVQVAG